MIHNARDADVRKNLSIMFFFECLPSLQTWSGWYCANLDGALILLGMKGQHRSLSLLHTELEALLLEMECMLLHQEVAISFQSNFLEL